MFWKFSDIGPSYQSLRCFCLSPFLMRRCYVLLASSPNISTCKTHIPQGVTFEGVQRRFHQGSLGEKIMILPRTTGNILTHGLAHRLSSSLHHFPLLAPCIPPPMRAITCLVSAPRIELMKGEDPYDESPCTFQWSCVAS